MLVVAFLQLSTVVVALVASVTSFDLPWESVVATYLSEHAFARLVIGAAGIAVVVAAIGLWRLRHWGWALMVTLVGLSLILDLVTWWRTGSQTGPATYIRMAFDVVSAFYLNTTAVQDAFRRPKEPDTPPVAGTRAAGRVDP